MTRVTFLGVGGEPVELSRDLVDRRLRDSLSGQCLDSRDREYDGARSVWNAMIDRRPALIARCRDAFDVQCCLCFAREHGLAVTVRGGGHNIGGTAVVDDALMIDLSPRRDVSVDGSRKAAEVAPGATLADVDRATVEHSRVVPSGIVSETGIAGLTLGGGFGWLSRRFGLTCDHLIEAEVVTGTGEILVASEREHPDLLWSLRGGGGAGGIVTRFRFGLQELHPIVVAGPIFCPGQEAEAAFEQFRTCAEAAPEELTCMLKLGTAPPAPFLPESMHGRPAAITVACHSGARGDVDRDLEALRAGGQPAADLVAERPFAEFQAMFDAGEPRGRRDYWKSEYIVSLDDRIREVLLEALDRLPSASANIKVFQLGGAVTRVPSDATAAGHRDAAYIVAIASAWDDPAADEANIAWVRETWQQVHELSGRGGYLNFLTEDAGEHERISAQSGVDRARLKSIVRHHDPDGLFRAPH
jgi:FAD/FMN-containing dehydrogenase